MVLGFQGLAVYDSGVSGFRYLCVTHEEIREPTTDPGAMASGPSGAAARLLLPVRAEPSTPPDGDVPGLDRPCRDAGPPPSGCCPCWDDASGMRPPVVTPRCSETCETCDAALVSIRPRSDGTAVVSGSPRWMDSCEFLEPVEWRECLEPVEVREGLDTGEAREYFERWEPERGSGGGRCWLAMNSSLR